MKKYNIGKIGFIFNIDGILHLFLQNLNDFNLPVKDWDNLKREDLPLCQEMIDCQLSDY